MKPSKKEAMEFWNNTEKLKKEAIDIIKKKNYKYITLDWLNEPTLHILMLKIACLMKNLDIEKALDYCEIQEEKTAKNIVPSDNIDVLTEQRDELLKQIDALMYEE